MNVELRHNPYTIRTAITVDGKVVTTGKLRELTADDHRLQMWIDRFFPCLLDVYDSPDVLSVVFRGTIEDFDDVCAAADEAELARECKITVSHQPTTNPESILAELKKRFDEAKNGPIPEFRDANLDARFKGCVDPDFEVSVIATMKAGKSTFLNAMIGHDLLPEDIEACTATVTRVRDTDGLTTFRARRILVGSESYTEWQDVEKGLLKEWNKDEVLQVEIEGDIPCIVSEGTRLVLVDTPGPNNARNANHGACLVNFIKKDSGLPPVVLYLLNAKTLFTNDNQILLQMISEEMKKAGKQSRDRFMFIMTHADAFDAEKGTTIADRMERARNDLAEKYDINTPNLFPANGLYAKLICCQRNGEILTKTESLEINNWIDRTQDSADYNYTRYMTLSPTVRKWANDRLEAARTTPDAQEMALLYSGVPAIEATIQEYLKKYAIPAKIHDAIKSFEHIMRRTSALDSIQTEISRGETRLKETHANIHKLQEQVAAGKNGQKLRERLEKMEWKETGEFSKKMLQINKEFLKYRKQYEESLGEGEVELEEANRRLSIVQRDVELIFKKSIKEIEQHAQTEVHSQIENMRREYVAHVEAMLGSINIKGVAEIGRHIANMATSLPSTQTIVRENSYDKRIVIGEHLERMTFSDGIWEGLIGLFGAKRNVKDYGKREFVIMNDVAKYFLDDLMTAARQMKDEGKEATRKGVERAKKTFVKYMDRLDDEVKKCLEELEKATSSKDDWKKHISENEARLHWYRDFDKRLGALLEL